MARRRVAAATLMIFAGSLIGCASVPKEHTGAATGAAVGAATGAAAGALLGKDTKSAVIGGLLGALVGGAVGHYYYDQKRSQEETAKAYGHTPAAGTLLRLEDASATPASVRPGDKVDLGATYAVLGASPGATLSVTETREIRHQGQLVGKPEVTVSRGGGTYTSSVPLVLPANAVAGDYVVTTTIAAENVRDSSETTFRVQ